MATDTLTVLQHPLALVKTWRADGTITPYGRARQFGMREVQVADVHALRRVLVRMEANPQRCIIRGQYVGDERARPLADVDPTSDDFCPKDKVLRRLDWFEDCPRAWVMLDVDNYEPLTARPLAEPAEAVAEFVDTCLPPEFAGASYCWQLSSSAGKPGTEGVLKAHLWFWLETPATSAQLKAWAGDLGVPVDTALFNPVQIHYTAAPAFEPGVDDPVATRSGFVQGLLGDAVALVLPEVEAVRDTPKPTRREVLRGAAAQDKVAQRLEVLGMVNGTGRGGELLVTCPLSERHSSESGPSSTVYYPAHTGGYRNGAFKCQHAHCRDEAQPVFLAAIGLDPLGEPLADDFEVVGGNNGVHVLAGSVVPDGEGDVPVDDREDTTVTALHLCTDQANAARLTKRYGRKLIVAHGEFFAWDGHMWARDDGLVARWAQTLSALITAEAKVWAAKKAATADEKELNDNVAKALIAWAKKSEMKATLDNALALAKRALALPDGKLDASPWLLNVENGVVDLRTGALGPHRAEHFMTKLCPVRYVPGAVGGGLWRKTLAQVACGDAALVAFLARWFGYCATGSTREQKFAVLWGNGRNGKSTVLDAVQGVLGSYASTAAPGVLVGRTASDRHPTEIADFMGRRMMTAHESGEGGALREDFVKQATGSDRLKARFMRGDFFEFEPTHKLQLITNHKPVIKGQDEGIWRRVMLVPFTARFGTPDEIAEGKATALRENRLPLWLASSAEREAVLAWLVAGAVEWYTDGLNPPAVVVAESKAYQSEQDRVLQFIDEECERGAQFSEPLKTRAGGGLYPAYVAWCREAGVMPLGRNNFTGELDRCLGAHMRSVEQVGQHTQAREKVIVYHGVRLANQGDGFL